MRIQDFFLTQESFELIINQKNNILQTNPIPENLEKYYQSEAYISHTDGKKNLFEKIYQQAKKYNLEQKRKLINNYHNTGKILDYGCGTGDFLAHIQHQYQVIGYEPNQKAAQIAQQKIIQKNINNFEKLEEIESNTLDIITLWHVLEHIPNLENITQNLYRILKNTGTLIIAVPNYKSYDAQYYKQYWAAYDVPRHIWHFDQMSMKKLWKSLNMTIIDQKPMLLDAFYVSILSEKYKGKHPLNFINGIIKGFQSNYYAKKTGEYSSLIYILKKNSN